jgi:DNA-binding HxlR family transcriptional regulator
MRHKSFAGMNCPTALTLDRVGEWWSILILRDAFHGLTRFDQFERSLGISTNSLTRRLNTLVESGLLARRRYADRPARHEYVLTDAGRDFQPVLVALAAWGRRHAAPERDNVLLVDADSGHPVDPVLIDRNTGREIPGPGFAYVPGPDADAATLRRLSGEDRA